MKINDRVQNKETIVSSYIENPLLINGLKFDLRIYVVITCVNPLRVYIYKEGIVRFATEEYSTNRNIFGNPFIHFTNYSINKHNNLTYGMPKTKDKTKTK